MLFKRPLLWLFTLGTLLLSACNLPNGGTAPPPDPNAVFTAAAQTASVQLTQAAEAAAQKTTTSVPALFQPTVTPAPTLAATLPPATATIDDKCDKAKFIEDITISDGTEFTAGETFTKTWRVQNIGDCTWTADYALVFDAGEQMGGASPQLLMGSVAPGDQIDISVDLVAPNAPGTYTGNWQIRNNTGVLFAKVYVQIKVVDPTFAVTSVKDVDAYYIAGRGAAFAAEITVSRAGTVKYYWIIRESGQADMTTPTEQIDFTSSGALDVSTLWSGCPHSGDFTVSLYVDDPNNQEFSSADFKCP